MELATRLSIAHLDFLEAIGRSRVVLSIHFAEKKTVTQSGSDCTLWIRQLGLSAGDHPGIFTAAAL